MYGKINYIDFTTASLKNDLEFRYDPMGNRTMKIEYASTGAKYTFYSRDAQGNIMATYTMTDDANDYVYLDEFDIYGSSRLGVNNIGKKMTELTWSGSSFSFTTGNKQYELTNHLGNVLATISDHKLPFSSNVNDGTVDYFLADITSSQDYYPFGMIMPERNWNSSSYRFGFNGKENDNEVKGTGNFISFEFRDYDSRLGRFVTIDPLSAKYPWQSPYAFAANNPILYVDIMGLGPGDPPTSTKSDANSIIENASKDLTQSDFYKNVSPEKFLSDLRSRVQNPTAFNQGHGTNFCWAAACLSYVWEKDPAGMSKAMINLYKTGEFVYFNGSYTTRSTPDDTYEAIGSSTFSNNADFNNVIDQMSTMTAASGLNCGIIHFDNDYDPGDEEDPMWSGGDLWKAKMLWNKMGYDVSIHGIDAGTWFNLDKGGLVTKLLNSSDIVLYVNSDAFKNGQRIGNFFGTHFIRVDLISTLSDSYDIHYWDYGQWKYRWGISYGLFNASTYGIIQIPR
ncbi:MAG TPA: RHS repeat-associated core domain-containing protein [Bacteroidales bacterium]|nr:RHS repeat-associated core domain-containing protein [Bacteroidales bacterium]